MNELQTLTDVSPELDLNALLKRSRLEPGSEDAVEFETLLAQVQAVAEPKAIYREAYIEHRGEDTITVDGVTFTSLTLRRNLEEVECVFPYVATCGTEIDQADPAGGEMLRQFWVDMIKEELLSSSMRHLKDYLERRHAIKKTTRMSPGAGDISVWAIEEQKKLFTLIGDVTGRIGVELTDSFLMIPNKSVSGIRYAAEIDFQACQVCRRKDCSSRCAPLNKEMWASIQEHDTN